jgi:polar amino acid transport system substrate-binding protein
MRRDHGTFAASLALLAAVCVLASSLAGCGGKVADVKTIKPGVLTVGSEATYPPFEMTVDKQFEGFDIDIASAIAARLGLKTDVVHTVFTKLIPGLDSGKYDIVMSAMTITPTRSKLISFSRPYMTADQSVCVANGSNITGLADLKGKAVGVETGTTSEAKALELLKAGGINKVQKYSDIMVAFEALEIGKIDAIINDYGSSLYMSQQRGHTEVVQLINTHESYGVGVRKGNAQMLDGVDKALAAIVKDGTYKKIYRKWFGKQQ